MAKITKEELVNALSSLGIDVSKDDHTQQELKAMLEKAEASKQPIPDGAPFKDEDTRPVDVEITLCRNAIINGKIETSGTAVPVDEETLTDLKAQGAVQAESETEQADAE